MLRHIIVAVTWRRLRDPFMLLMLIGLYLILAGTEGVNLNGVGAPFLFWHEKSLIQFISVAALGFFIEEWVYVAFLLDTDPENPNPSKWYFERGEGDDPGKLKNEKELITAGITSSIACTLVLCVVFTTAPIVFRGAVDLPTDVKWWLVFIYLYVGLFFGATMRWVIYNYIQNVKKDVINRRILREDKLTRQFVHAQPDDAGQPEVSGDDQAVIDTVLTLHRIAFWKQSISLLAVIVFCLLHWIPWTRPLFGLDVFKSVAGYFCAFLTMVVGAYGFTVFNRRRPWYEVTVCIGLALVLAPALIAYLSGASPIWAQSVRGLTADPPPTANAAIQRVQAVGAAQRAALARSDKAGGAPAATGGTGTGGSDERTDRDALQRWHQLLGPKWKSKKPPLIVVANSGGGIKAQMWSTIVLNAIEQRLATNVGGDGNGHLFPHHVRLMTGASGGAVGASYWVATVPPLENGKAWSSDDPRALHWAFNGAAATRQQAVPILPETMIEVMGRDALSDTGRQMFFNDFLGFPLNALGRIFGIPHLLDARGRALEQAWERHSAPADHPEFGPMSQPFRNLTAGEEAGWRPTLALSPCVAEDGRRLLISNQPIEYVLRSDLGAGSKSLAGYSARLLNANHAMPVSTVARLNANFPVVVDSPSIPLAEQFRIMDAGYIDNYGLVVAAQWLNANRNWLKENTSGVLLVQISAAPLERTDAAAESASGLPEVVGFISASFNKTLHHQDMVLDRLQTALNHDQPQSQDHDAFFRFVTLEYAGPASLSWYLTSAEKYSLIYPFLSETDPGGDGDVFRKKRFSEDFQRRVFDGGQAIFDARVDDRVALQHLRDSRTTIRGILADIENWWKIRGR